MESFLRLFFPNRGSSIFYFDAGDAPSSIIPIWVNMYANKTSAGNNIIDSIVPEDQGYSPFWKVIFFFCVCSL
jgi:hypothetical protein